MKTTTPKTHLFAATIMIASTLLSTSFAEAKLCRLRYKVACSGAITTESSSGYITYILNRVVYGACGKVVSDKYHKLTGTPEEVEAQLRRAGCSPDQG